MKILVLGIGNVMYSDEGIGVHISQVLKKNYKFTNDKNSVDFVDGGTLATLLIPLICDYDRVIIIDCIEADDVKIGDVYFFDFGDLPSYVNFSGSAHEIEMLQTLTMLDITDERPPTKILGIVPKRVVPMSFDLSKEILKGSKLAEKIVLKELENLGFFYEKIANFDAQDIANEYSKGKF